ncbi:MAG: hypothetical protein HY954_08680 [Deltaproteobacteria bacterium]|nr:hypothetical protein [Deltaproteobacteria bacterium]
MLKVIVICLALLLPLAATGAVFAEEAKGNGEVEKDGGLAKTLEQRLKTNTAFLKAAGQIVYSSKNKEASSFLKMAEDATREGQEHYKKGEFEFALEDVMESTHLAISAIILSKNQQNATMRDFVIQEELSLKAKHDIERKEGLIKKGMAEVEIFIKTAERLLKQDKNEAASAKLEETKGLYESAKTNLANARFDSALENINKAYNLATATVKQIKRSQNDIITFPRPVLTDEKDIVAYEIKKNNSYIYFASQVINDGDEEANDILDDGKKMKDEAVKALEGGDNQKAIEKFKASTDLIIKAIKKTYKESR